MGGLTGYYNNYSGTELVKALQSWVDPYPKPIILNHDLNSEPIGRVMAAKMDKEQDGSSYVRLQIAITDPIAAQKVLDQRYLTGSVGGRANKAVCSITGEDLAKPDASGRMPASKYKRGAVYKGKVAFLDMQDISFKEYSFVNQPADQRSGVRKKASDSQGAVVTDSDWVARSSAFILSMNEEEIYSIEEQKSIFSEMKKKESRPVYLHVKGAFLSAMAINESENYNIQDSTLLSSENKINKDEEKTEMTVSTEQEDILAVSEELSEDLSSIASDAAKEEPAENTEAKDSNDETSEVEETKEEKSEDVSTEDKEQSDVQEEKAESEDSEKSVETPEEIQDKEGVKQESEELNDQKSEEATEQTESVLEEKVRLLEEENKKLKAALHKVLAERVVDAKIAAGIESVSEREELIKDHMTRTASSLADSLRDVAKLPAKKNVTSEIPEITSEAEVSTDEDRVTSVDSEKDDSEPKAVSAEQLFVDALMGRRSL